MIIICIRGYDTTTSPGPLERLYSGQENGYVNANSPQPNPFPALAINRVSVVVVFVVFEGFVVTML